MIGKFGQAMLATLLGTLAITAPASASAETQWARHHPARHHIDQRLARQQHRITHERRAGEISGRQAHALRAQDRAIHRQELRMARADHNRGHLTPGQAQRLNGELNTNSRAIGR